MAKLRDSWCTPGYIARPVVQYYYRGLPDLDPCTNRWATLKAKRGIILPEDGLTVDWGDARSLWMNPGYSGISPWACRFMMHMREKRRRYGLFIVPLDPSTHWWKAYVRGRPIVLFDERVRFDPPPGVRATSPDLNVTIVEYGDRLAALKRAFQDLGTVYRAE